MDLHLASTVETLFLHYKSTILLGEIEIIQSLFFSGVQGGIVTTF